MSSTIDRPISVTVPPGYQAVKDQTGEMLAIVRPERLDTFEQLDTLIFDLDGIIIDPSESIQTAHPMGMQFWLEKICGFSNCADLVTEEDIASFKLAGGFNDDWNIAASIGLIYATKSSWFNSTDGQVLMQSGPSLSKIAKQSASCGGGIPGIERWLLENAPKEAVNAGLELCKDGKVVQLFKEVVSGPYCMQMYDFDAEYFLEEGTIVNDRLLVDTRQLELPFKIAVFTGRTFGEAQIGLKLVGLDGWVDTANMITWNDGMTKPDGRPLDILTKRLDSKAAAFIGDNRDDMRSVHMYRENGDRKIVSVQVCFGASAETARQAFIDGGADMITATTTDALNAIRCLWEGDQ